MGCSSGMWEKAMEYIKKKTWLLEHTVLPATACAYIFYSQKKK